MGSERTKFADAVGRRSPLSARSLREALRDGSANARLADQLLAWAHSALGSSYIEVLAQGYDAFTQDVSRSQALYERDERYRFNDFASAANAVYFNDAFQKDYHWGVYATTFAWPHHARIVEFFLREFVESLGASGLVGDFGSGSSVWSCLLASQRSGWNVRAWDINPFSVGQAQLLINGANLSDRVSVDVADVTATNFTLESNLDAAFSCFVLEHLEDPLAFVSSVRESLPTRSPAFFTTVVTAAETDHIFEFRSEGQVIRTLEEAGFRVSKTLSIGPENYPEDFKFFPRSIALVAHTKLNAIW